MRKLIIGLVGLVGLSVGAASAQTRPHVAEPPHTFVGSFVVVKQIDDMSDQDRSYVFSMDGDKASLAWGCRLNGLNVLLTWHRYFTGIQSQIPVEYRFHGQRADMRRFDLAPNHKVGLLPIGDVTTFTTAALAQPTVMMRVTDRDGEHVTATFNLNGLAEALAVLPCAGDDVLNAAPR